MLRHGRRATKLCGYKRAGNGAPMAAMRQILPFNDVAGDPGSCRTFMYACPAEWNGRLWDTAAWQVLVELMRKAAARDTPAYREGSQSEERQPSRPRQADQIHTASIIAVVYCTFRTSH